VPKPIGIPADGTGTIAGAADGVLDVIATTSIVFNLDFEEAA
jgi:hypothetical protein